MTWRDRLHAALDRAGLDHDIDVSRTALAYGWVAWGGTALAAPFAFLADGWRARLAWGVLAGVWLGGAVLARTEHGTIQFIDEPMSTTTTQPECSRCDRIGESDTYKGDAVSRCPDCNRILVRELDP